MTTHATAANAIKSELKKAFPGIKFSVRSQSYSGGDSVRVSWDLGPTSKEVEHIIDKYQHGWFDGMTDCYNYTGNTKTVDPAGAIHELPGVKFVFADRNIPEPIYTQMEKDIRALCTNNDGTCPWLEPYGSIHRILANYPLMDGYHGVKRTEAPAGTVEEMIEIY